MGKDIMQAMRGRKEELPQLLPGQFGFCVDTDELFIGNGDGTANIQMGAKGEKGDKGDKGIVFTPSISEEGILSWTNDGELPNPPDLDLKEIPLKSITADKITDYTINNMCIGDNAIDARTIKDGVITKNKLSEELLEQINGLLLGATEFRKELDALNSMFPSDILRNVVSKLEIEVWKLQRGGHSEYEFYRFRCVSCTLKDGTKITNPKKEYIQYGDGTQYIRFPSVGVNPDKPILIPLTSESLNKCLYIGEEQDGYLFLSFYLVYWLTTEDKTEDGVTYVVYDNVTLDLNID